MMNNLIKILTQLTYEILLLLSTNIMYKVAIRIILNNNQYSYYIATF